MGQELYPRMRALDFFPAEVSGQKVICLRDPLKLSEKILFVSYQTFFVISLFDGQHSVLDIQSEFMRRFGEILYREKVEELVSQLDDSFLLDTKRFREAERATIESFRTSSLRSMSLAGESYEADGEELRNTIFSYFKPPEGPGFSDGGCELGKLTGAIAPHIDYGRGGPCYAWAHRAIQRSRPAELFVILGTAHAPMKKPIAFTRKSFQTPWGVVDTDQDFLSVLGGKDFYEDEWVHKGEHSIELQLMFLRALRESPPFQIVPILCGSFQEAILQETSPLNIPGVGPFIESLTTALQRTEKKVCVLASADMAHLGLRFGDADPPNRFSLQELEEEDRVLLRYAERMDGENFFQVLSREKNRRKVCGLAPIYILLSVLKGSRGKVLKYSQAHDPASQSVVTFASMGFWSPE